MKQAIKEGLGFGLTSGIITTLGLMVGLNSGTGLKLAVIGGILTVAISDAISDGFGIYASKESNKKISRKYLLQAAVSTFLTKLVIGISFIIPLLLLEFKTAIIVNLIWGYLLMIGFNYFIARIRKEKPFGLISKHLIAFTVVIILTHYLGMMIASYFG